jgi:hypothetical protein
MIYIYIPRKTWKYYCVPIIAIVIIIYDHVSWRGPWGDLPASASASEGRIGVWIKIETHRSRLRRLRAQ